MKLKYYKKKTILSIIGTNLLIIIVSIIISIILINKLSNRINSYIEPIANMEVKKVITSIINKSINKVSVKNNLFTIEKDNDNEIDLINYNTLEVSKLLNEITGNIESEIKRIENSHEDIIVLNISSGNIFNNYLLKGLGPKIMLKLDYLGNVISKIETEVKPYGINNAYLEVRVRVSVSGMIKVPFASQEITIENTVPLSMNVVNGTVPNPYIYSYK